MSWTARFLWSILLGQIVLLLIFGAFYIGKYLVALSLGMWTGIAFGYYGLSLEERTLLPKAVGALLLLQATIFFTLEFMELRELYLSEVAFVMIGVWIGLYTGLVLEKLHELEEKVAKLEEREFPPLPPQQGSDES